MGQPCFLDSDDLRDLRELRQNVRDSSVLVLIQSTNVLKRPFCLVELLTAIEASEELAQMIDMFTINTCAQTFEEKA